MRLVPLAGLAVALALVGPSAGASPPRKKPAVDVTGTYSSNYDEVRLVQRGTLVEGEYVCCGGGTITGRLDGKVIRFHWEQADGAGGGGVWTVLPGGAIRGTWGTGDSDDDGGEWNLDRSSAIAN